MPPPTFPLASTAATLFFYNYIVKIIVYFVLEKGRSSVLPVQAVQVKRLVMPTSISIAYKVLAEGHDAITGDFGVEIQGNKYGTEPEVSLI